jgi:CRISPR system Cascade subunit CasE
MIELQFDMGALIKYLESHGLNRNNDQDLGYGTHAWLAGTFGNCAPKPFRLMQAKSRPPRILGYSSVSKDDLLKQAKEFASPSALSVCDLANDMHSKLMPEEWRRGRRLNFRVLACPVSRKDGVEKDIFLRMVDRVTKEEKLDRSKIYCDWIKQQLDGIAKTEHVSLDSFQMLQFFRRGESQRPSKLVRPRAEFSGTMEIEDVEQFLKTLNRGLGRHRAFGYGMLLLSPAS